jgi:hypothetical protein
MIISAMRDSSDASGTGVVEAAGGLFGTARVGACVGSPEGGAAVEVAAGEAGESASSPQAAAIVAAPAAARARAFRKWRRERLVVSS